MKKVKQDLTGMIFGRLVAIIARLQAELKYYGPQFAPQRHLFKKYGITSGEDTTE